MTTEPITFGPGPLFVFERLSLFELLWGLWKIFRAGSGAICYIRASRLARRLIQGQPRIYKLGLEEFPAAFTAVPQIALHMDRDAAAGESIQHSRLHSIQSLYSSLDLTMAVKKAALWYYRRKARVAYYLTQLCQTRPDNTPIYVYLEDKFPLTDYWTPEILNRLSFENSLPYQAWQIINRVFQHLAVSAFMLIKALYFFWKHRPGLRNDIAARQFSLAAYLHSPPLVKTYEEILLKTFAPQELVYIFTRWPGPEYTARLHETGIAYVLPGSLPAHPWRLVRQILRDCIAWFFSKPFGALGSSLPGGPFLNLQAVYLFGFAWDAAWTTDVAKYKALLVQDEGIEANVRQPILNAAGAKQINYIHGERFRTVINTYCYYDVLCIYGEHYAQLFRDLGARVGEYALTSSLQLDRLYKAMQTTLPPELTEIKQRYKLIVGFSPGYDRRTASTRQVNQQFAQAMSSYAAHNPQAMVLIKLHPSVAVYPYYAIYESIKQPRIQIITNEIDTYALMAAADLVVTSFSTTGIEAIAGGKQTVYLNFSGDADLLPYGNYSPRLVIQDESEINKAFDRYLGGERVIPPELQNEITRRHMVAFDGQMWKRFGECLRRHAGAPPCPQHEATA